MQKKYPLQLITFLFLWMLFSISLRYALLTYDWAEGFADESGNLLGTYGKEIQLWGPFGLALFIVRWPQFSGMFKN